jgi:hypothetical protein
VLALVHTASAARPSLAQRDPGPADANTSRNTAAAHFRDAQARFARRDFTGAAAAFEAAAKIKLHPAPLLNAADAWELGGDAVNAARNCDAALAMDGIEERFRREAEARLARIVSRIATLELTGPPSLIVRLDGEAIELPARRRVTPGAHSLVIIDGAARGERTQTLELARGELRRIELAPPAPGVAAAPGAGLAAQDASRAAARPGGRARRIAGWVALGMSAVATSAALYFGLGAADARSVYTEAPSRPHRETFERARQASLISTGIAGTALAAGVSLLLWPTGGDAPPRDATPVAAAGAGASARAGRVALAVTPRGFAVTFRY